MSIKVVNRYKEESTVMTMLEHFKKETDQQNLFLMPLVR